MTNAETITKLNEALNTLIKAYEELQEDSNILENKVKDLEEEVSELKSAKHDLEVHVEELTSSKEDLEKNLDEYESHKEEDNTNINSMLGKIESLLGSKSEKKSFDNAKEDDTEEVKEENTLLDNISDEETKSSLYEKVEEISEDKDGDDKENKIDLNRMASLLNGFNK